MAGPEARRAAPYSPSVRFAPDILRTLWLLGLGFGLPLGVGLWVWHGPVASVRFLVGLVVVLSVEYVFIAAMIRRIGAEKRSLADAITFSRGVAAATLAALVGSGIVDRIGPAGWIAWLLLLYAATLSDWIDGPLARRAGPTLLGGVLDIEFDSLLTLVSGTAAVAWGGLPWFVLLPPLVRYAQPDTRVAAG